MNLKVGYYFAPEKPFKVAQFNSEKNYAGEVKAILGANKILLSVLGNYCENEFYTGFSKFRCLPFDIEYTLKYGETYFISETCSHNEKWEKLKFVSQNEKTKDE